MKLPEFDIVADIGGTNARFACIESGVDRVRLQYLSVVQCNGFPGVSGALDYYVSHLCAQLNVGSVSINAVCLAIAAPIENDFIDLPNNHWCFTKSELASELKKEFAADLLIINDFTAQIMAVETLAGTEISPVHNAVASELNNEGGVIAALGAGTGLGVAARLPSGEVLPSEGGHIGFAPSNEHEIELLRWLLKRFDRVSVERIVSGQGLENLFWANSVIAGEERELSAEAVSQGAFDGDNMCLATVKDFANILGSVAGDVALVTGARGGVYIAGGIVPKLLPLLDTAQIRKRFNAKGRYGDYCAAIPLFIVLAEQPGLRGCAQALKMNSMT